jgi:S1-C subfamily serine protease
VPRPPFIDPDDEFGPPRRLLTPVNIAKAVLGLLVFLAVVLLFAALLMPSLLGPYSVDRAQPYVATDLDVDVSEPCETENGACYHVVRYEQPFLTPVASLIKGNSALVASFYADDEHPVGVLNGVVLRPGLVLTSAHGVTEDGITAEEVVVYCGGRNVPAQVVALNESADVAVLRADCPGQELELADEDAVEGTVRIIGLRFAADIRLAIDYIGTGTLVDGNLLPSELQDLFTYWEQKVMEDQGLTKMTFMDFAAYKGMSGSPIFTADGRIVGLLSCASQAFHVSCFTPASNIKAVLEPVLK